MRMTFFLLGFWILLGVGTSYPHARRYPPRDTPPFQFPCLPFIKFREVLINQSDNDPPIYKYILNR